MTQALPAPFLCEMRRASLDFASPRQGCGSATEIDRETATGASTSDSDHGAAPVPSQNMGSEGSSGSSYSLPFDAYLQHLLVCVCVRLVAAEATVFPCLGGMKFARSHSRLLQVPDLEPRLTTAARVIQMSWATLRNTVPDWCVKAFVVVERS